CRPDGRRLGQAAVGPPRGRRRPGADHPGGGGAAAGGRPAQGRRARGRPARRDHGRQAHARPGAAVPPDRAALGHGGPDAGRPRRGDRRHHQDRRPYRRGDGGVDRGHRRRPRPGRHAQGRRPGRQHRPGTRAAQRGRQDRHLGTPGGPPVTAPRRTARVIVASNRAAAGVYADTSGPILVDGLRELGYTVEAPVVVPDGEPVTEALREAVAAGVAVVLTSGGTGVSPTDRTPAATLAVLAYQVPGIPEAPRAYGAGKVPAAGLSRGVAGVAGRTLTVNLAGSRGGARDGRAGLGPLLDHAVDQIHGGDHPRPPHG